MDKYALARSIGPWSAGTVVEVIDWRGVGQERSRAKTVIPGYVTVRTVSPINGDYPRFDVEWPQALVKLRDRAQLERVRRVPA